MDEEILKDLKDRGFRFVDTKTPYEVVRMKGPCTIVEYTSGKILVQGKEPFVSEIKKVVDVKDKKVTDKSYGVMVGSDETLKGDTFGGIVVAGFRADDKDREILRQLGVQDSKNLKDENIIKVAESIKKNFKNNFYIAELEPAEYNNETIMGNSTLLLNRLHKQVNEKLRTSNSKHVVDKYPGCTVGDVIETKAESHYLEVAAASILAREKGIEQLQRLSGRAGFQIPKGSTHVKKALERLKKEKLKPENFVKLHFSNVQKFLGLK